ncbi:hypothetical protein RV10_GL002665 [Enterococcus pallens]|nr:hypothetical protein RV10_GL002665 [Enterococcus pallens]
MGNNHVNKNYRLVSSTLIDYRTIADKLEHLSERKIIHENESEKTS